MEKEKRDSHILVATSVAMESEGIKRELGSHKTIHLGGRTVLCGSIGNRSVRLMDTGPGVINTAQSLTAAIENCMPETILMSGIAGGFSRAGLTIGDIAIASEENDAQLGIEPEAENEPLDLLPFDLGIFNGVGIKHRIEMDAHLATAARDILTVEFSDLPVVIKLGPFITVSTITATEKRANRLFRQFRPCMENMEGVAGAYIAKHYNIPFFEIRCASNLVGKRDRASWDLGLACERSSKAAISCLKRQEVIS